MTWECLLGFRERFDSCGLMDDDNEMSIQPFSFSRQCKPSKSKLCRVGLAHISLGATRFLMLAQMHRLCNAMLINAGIGSIGRRCARLRTIRLTTRLNAEVSWLMRCVGCVRYVAAAAWGPDDISTGRRSSSSCPRARGASPACFHHSDVCD